MSTLEIQDLHVAIGDTEILKGVDLTLNSGDIHALMGPNGSGKSTLSYVIAGHPHYPGNTGRYPARWRKVFWTWRPTNGPERNLLPFQYPVTIPGVSVAISAHGRIQRSGLHQQRCRQQRQRCHRQQSHAHAGIFAVELNTKMKEFNVDSSFARRYLNEGFSGGEKKRTEVPADGNVGAKFRDSGRIRFRPGH